MTCALLLTSCSSQQPSTLVPSASTAATKKVTDSSSQVTFDVPANWSVETLKGGTLVMCPDVEDSWQANAFIERRRNDANLSMDDSVSTLLENLRHRHQAFQLVDKVLQPAGAHPFATVTYTHEDKKTGLSLTNSETVIYLPANQTIFLMTSSATSLAAKYKPYFDGIKDSVLRAL